MLLSIIIISYNTQELTLACLQSVLQALKTDNKLQNSTEIIVVDNHSHDGSSKAIEKLLTNQPVKHLFLQNQQNLGFAQANNQAIKKAQGQYLLLLNSDTLVKKTALTTLINTFKDHPLQDTTANLDYQQGKLDRLGILTPLLLNPDQSVQPQGGNLPNLISLFFHMTLLDDLPIIGQFLPSTQHTGKNINKITPDQADLIQKDWIGGTAMMIRKLVVAEIGPLDPNIFMYGEDMEFCLRAKKHHWDIALCPQAQVVHYGSGSSSNHQAVLGEFKGFVYIWSKHRPAWELPWAKKLLKLGAKLRQFLFGTILNNQEKARLYQQVLSHV
ncbi:MAG: glycosyltransferase [Candidatus Pacebacteria bacterium]|nr:glycosyltransferase [Candidatus Paceibacterota bacterium]